MRHFSIVFFGIKNFSRFIVRVLARFKNFLGLNDLSRNGVSDGA